MLIKTSDILYLNKTAVFNLHKRTKIPPLYMRNGVYVFKLIAPSIKDYFEKNALLHEISIWQ